MNSIAFVTELFYPSIGGQEFRFLRLASGLARKGFNVTLFTTDHTGGSLPREEVIEGVHVVRYVVLKKYVKPGSRALTQAVKFAIAMRKLVPRLTAENDFVLVNQMPILHLFFIPRGNVICIDWCEAYRKSTLRYPVIMAAKRFNKGIAVSEDIAMEIHQANPRMSIDVIRTPIDVDKYVYNGRKDADLVLYIGRLVPHKNVLSLAKAIVYLNEKFRQKKRLVIVGDGPLKQTLAKMQEKFKYIEVLGKVDEAKKIELLKKAFVLAIPSYREGFPNVVAEAIASLTPVLTVKSPLNNVYPFVKGHKIGFMAPSPSPKHLAETIAKVSDEEWRRALTNEIRLREEFREEYNINKLVRFIRGCPHEAIKHFSNGRLRLYRTSLS